MSEYLPTNRTISIRYHCLSLLKPGDIILINDEGLKITVAKLVSCSAGPAIISIYDTKIYLANLAPLNVGIIKYGPPALNIFRRIWIWLNTPIGDLVK